MTKEKIPFTQETALSIIEKFQLSQKTLNVWRNRGHIPPQYFDPNFDSSAKADKDSDYQKLIEILSMTEICNTNFRAFDGTKAIDVVRGKSTMTVQDMKLMRTEITEIRNKLQRAFRLMTESTFNIALTDKRLHGMLIAGNEVYGKIANLRAISPTQKQNLALRLKQLHNNLHYGKETESVLAVARIISITENEVVFEFTNGDIKSIEHKKLYEACKKQK